MSRIFTIPVASVCTTSPKAEKEGRSQDEVDQVIRWLTGFEPASNATSRTGQPFEEFFAQAHLNATLITGVVCGVRVESVEDPLMQQIRYPRQAVDELARAN